MAEKYNIARTEGVCCQCGAKLEPSQEFLATIRQEGDELVRIDYCTTCRPTDDDAPWPREVLGAWRSRVPEPREKKKLFIDDDALLTFFDRLDGTDDPQRISFRYVLTLILMRKKLVVYESSRTESDGTETWIVRRRGTEDRHEVIDPRLDEDQIEAVSAQLGQVMETPL